MLENNSKVRPGVISRWSCSNNKYYIVYVCPFCHNELNENREKCDCGVLFDWSKKAKIIMRPDIIWEE